MTTKMYVATCKKYKVRNSTYILRLNLYQLQVIGRLNLGGPKCEGSALHHWKEIQASPRRQIAEWHKLKE